MESFVSAAVDILAGCDIPSARSRSGDAVSESRSSSLRDTIIDVVKSSAEYAAAEAVGALPFGSVAVSLCKDTASRITTLTENKEAASTLLEWTSKIVNRSDKILRLLENRTDKEAIDLSHDLVEATFFAFRITRDAERRPGVLRYASDLKMCCESVPVSFPTPVQACESCGVVLVCSCVFCDNLIPLCLHNAVPSLSTSVATPRTKPLAKPASVSKMPSWTRSCAFWT
jgi:hypothetical protein